MNRLLFFVFLYIITPIKVFSQNISLSELISLSNKESWIEVDKVLAAKGWVYHNSKKGDATSYDVISWSYKKDYYSDKAVAWFYVFSDNGVVASVTYEIFNKPAYNIIQKAITTSVYKITGSSVEDDEVKTEYQGGSHSITVKYSKRERDDYSDNSLTAYSIKVKRDGNTFTHLNGLQKYTDDDGNTSEVIMKSGVPIGTLKKYNSEGKLIMTTEFTNGKKTGIYKEYDEEGNVVIQAAKIDGVFHGTYTYYEYYPEGVVYSYSGQMINGEKTGVWNTSRQNGDNKKITQFETFDDNGVLNGPFKDRTSDSIITCTYRNGELHGKFIVKRSLYTMLTGKIDADETDVVTVCEGNYSNGKRTGTWKNFDFSGTLIAEGNYYEHEKQGDWKYYHNTYESNNSLFKYSGLLARIIHYDQGKKNGKAIQYSYLEDIPVKCDLQKNPDKTPIDTCYNQVIIKAYTTAFYKDDLLHGPYESRDSADVLIKRGIYVNDIRHGPFIQTFVDENSDGIKYYMYEEGSYENGEREGPWKWYKHPAFTKMAGNYKKGELDGRFVYYNEAHTIEKEINFISGKYDLVNIYGAGQQKIRSYEIISETEKAITCTYTKIYKDSSVSQVYYLPKHSNKSIASKWFDEYFQGEISEEDNNATAYPEGAYKKYDAKGSVLEEGNYTRLNKNGKWTYRFPGSGVYAEQEFNYGIGGIEYFYLENLQTYYTGELKIFYPNGKLQQEIDIEKGIRHGKTKYYTPEGKTEKTLKYKNGLLVAEK